MGARKGKNERKEWKGKNAKEVWRGTGGSVGIVFLQKLEESANEWNMKELNFTCEILPIYLIRDFIKIII